MRASYPSLFTDALKKEFSEMHKAPVQHYERLSPDLAHIN